MQSRRATIQLFTTEAGGRKSAIALTDGSYRPHVVVNGGPYLGVIMRSETISTLRPGETTDVILDLIYDIDYRALRSGAYFTIQEGPHTIGSGQIS